MVFCALLLSSCGFHLRSDQSLPTPLRVLYVNSDDPYGTFTANLKKSLQAVGVYLTKTPNESAYILQVSQTNLGLTTTSAGNSNQATIYTGNYSVQISLMNNKQKVLVPTQIVKSTTTFIVNPQQTLSSTNQNDLIAKQLQYETINKIFAILTSEQIQKAVRTSHENKR